MKIFVPGGNGFLGKRVVKKLSEAGADFVSLSLRDGCDFRDFKETLALFQRERFDAVLNCAAYVGGIQFGYEHPAELFFNNIQMATYLMESARLTGVKKFVNPISNCTYPGDLTRDFREGEWWNGPMHESVMVYAFARKASWMQSWAYDRQYGFKTTNIILPNMYGPGDHFEETRSHALGALVMKFAEAKKNKAPQVVVWGTGKPVREWLYVDDGAEIMIKALDINTSVDPINVGMGFGVTIAELASLIKEAVGYDGKVVFDPSRPDGAPHKTMNNDRLKDIFKWVPPTDLKNGIQVTVTWYMENRG
jgi:GDP-L-fucose synthase